MDFERVDAVLVYALLVGGSQSSANGAVIAGRSPRVCSHVRWAEDCAVPVGHEKIIALVQTVGACLYAIVSLLVEVFLSQGCTATARMHARMLADRGTVRTGSETFLALLQLFQQAEVTRHFCAHGCVRKM